VLAETWPILLDFDGPVTPLYVGGRNQRLSDRMRAALIGADIRLPEDISNTVDPLAVLRWSALHVPAPLTDEVEQLCTAGEVELAQKAQPTPGAHDLLDTCHRVGRPVVLVSNNAPETIHAYLDRFGLQQLVAGVVGRSHGHPELMKPHPDAIERALRLLRQPASSCAFVGDSVSDIQVSHLTGVRSIGFAKHPRRGQELGAAEADALVVTIQELVDAVAQIHIDAGSRSICSCPELGRQQDR
jgi:phosphoglycolate phosphatase